MSSRPSCPCPQSNPLLQSQPRSPSSHLLQLRPPSKPSPPLPKRWLNPKPSSRFSLPRRKPVQPRAGRSVVSLNNRLPTPILAAKAVRIFIRHATPTVRPRLAVKTCPFATMNALLVTSSRVNHVASFARANPVVNSQVNAKNRSANAKNNSTNAVSPVRFSRSPRPPLPKPRNLVFSVG